MHDAYVPPTPRAVIGGRAGAWARARARAAVQPERADPPRLVQQSAVLMGTRMQTLRSQVIGSSCEARTGRLQVSWAVANGIAENANQRKSCSTYLSTSPPSPPRRSGRLTRWCRARHSHPTNQGVRCDRSSRSDISEKIRNSRRGRLGLSAEAGLAPAAPSALPCRRDVNGREG